MPPVIRKIADGVTLNVIPTGKFKTNYLSVNFLTPLDESTAAKNSLLVRVLKRGTKNYPTMAELSRRSEELYGTRIGASIAKRGENQIVSFSAYALKNEYAIDSTDILSETLELLREVMFEPRIEDGAFKSEYVESEKRNLTDEIRSQINNKKYYAVMRCREEMCRGEKFGVSEYGTPESVAEITPVSLYEHYLSFIRGCRVEIYFVGECDPDALAASLTVMFAPLGALTPAPLETVVKRRAEAVREITEEQPVEQGKLSMGFRTGSVLTDSDYHVFSLFCELFGGSPMSKLFMNVREKLSLCYYCSAIPEAQKGVMIVASGIENQNKQKAQDEILAQLENIRNGDFTDGELDSAKKSLINAYREASDSPATLEAWYVGRMLAGRNDSPDDTAEAVGGVSAEQVAECAKKITLDTVYFMLGTLTEKNGGAASEAEENDNE